VDTNYVVIHADIGDEGKDNNDLAARLGVVLDKGVPGIVVLEPSGGVLEPSGGVLEPSGACWNRTGR